MSVCVCLMKMRWRLERWDGFNIREYIFLYETNDHNSSGFNNIIMSANYGRVCVDLVCVCAENNVQRSLG